MSVPEKSRRLLESSRAVLLHLFLCCLLMKVTNVEACSGKTCSSCITSGAECAWCADTNFSSVAGERCALMAALKERGCVQIENPTTKEDYSHRKDQNVTDGDDEQGTDAIQLQPQAVRILLRPRGKGHDVNVTFRPANNFPVDLYFLFDLSRTMKDYIQDLSNLATGIADEIGKISKNYRMGYGTFQDKVLLPFTNTHPVKLLNPCPPGNDCAPPFDYRHELNLTRDLNNFTAAVNISKTTGNIDSPEGGFDAMMQTIVCKGVGWRENSRQLIIFASDARMHFAGDGKLAGLVTPNDGHCHLDDGRTNTVASTQDYPSVGQLSAALDSSKKYVIFAVKEAVLEQYQQLHARLPRSSVNVLRSGKDSNVVDIVRDKYREMTQGVQLKATTSSDHIRVSITPTCDEHDGSSCTNVAIGEKVKPFRVNIRAESCPIDPKGRTQTVTITPTDFLKDSLNITVEIICDCDCQLPSNVTHVPSEQCSQGNGTVECGICRCFDGRSGSSCECGQQDLDSTFTHIMCSEEGSNTTTALACNGVGECICGVCQCQPHYSGRFCQCNDQVCPIFDGLVCGGNGECRCEECHCKENFTGLACQCSTANDTCIPTQSDEDSQVCSGNGDCHCGSCVCKAGYVGLFCEICFSCGNSVCEVDNYGQCANCALTPDKNCPDDCPKIIVVEELNIEDEQIKACKNFLTERCHVRFSVHNPGVNTTLYVEKAKVCTEGVDITVIVLGVVGGVLAVGLILLLLVKLLTSLLDRLEYQHFLRQLQSPKWAKQNNPIYKEATTTYHNPVMSKD